MAKSGPIELSPRMHDVLREILDEYVETGQPVASRSVAERSARPVSPATVRNVMGDLTEIGLLVQPHASAGRIPTDRAFRLHVDELLRELPPHASRVARVEEELGESFGDADDLLRRAADLLSRTTGQLGFFVAAHGNRVVLRRVYFARLSSERVLAVLVCEGGVVQTRIVEERQSDQRLLDRVSTKLSELVAGCTLDEARARLASAIERERAQRDALWSKIATLGAETLVPGEAEIYVGDRNQLLAMPEFSDIDRLRELLAALDEKQTLLRLVDSVLRAEVLRVVIGSELHQPAIHACAVVTAPFGASPPLGGVGVIGPIRMRYERVIPFVHQVSERLSQVLA